MFAMAMALNALTEKCPIKKTVHSIAEGLEGYAIKNNLSAIGEAFDAKVLCQIGQNYYNQTFDEPKIQMVTLNFTNRDQMMAIFDKCRDEHLYVLFPYLSSDNGIDPQSIQGKPTPDQVSQQMMYAHWSVIEKRKVSSEESSPTKLHILEGWNEIYGGPENSYLPSDDEEVRDQFQELFDSNKSLGGTMSWNAYIDKYIMPALNAEIPSEAVTPEDIAKLEAKKQAQAELNNLIARLEERKKAPFSTVNIEGAKMTESVKLQGFALLIGVDIDVQEAVNDLIKSGVTAES